MGLREKINDDVTTAMKAKDDMKVSVLRLLKAAIMKFEVSGALKKVASDEDVLTLLGKEVKQRKDSIAAFRGGGREDLAKKEESELKILESYMPEQMGEEELKKIASETIAEIEAKGKSDFGRVMRAVMAKVKGKADGQSVRRLVGELMK